jgi:hypothetical protein
METRTPIQSASLKNNARLLTALKILMAAVTAWMSYMVINTSVHSSLIKEWNYLASIPWMRATLWDFYANVLVICLWVCYKEETLAMRIIWLILLCGLGSIATCAYVFLQLFRLKPGEGIRELLTGR